MAARRGGGEEEAAGAVIHLRCAAGAVTVAWHCMHANPTSL